ncbi:unnamed protein product, partial [Meganyctiphanes norvegica]
NSLHARHQRHKRMHLHKQQHSGPMQSTWIEVDEVGETGKSVDDLRDQAVKDSLAQALAEGKLFYAGAPKDGRGYRGNYGYSTYYNNTQGVEGIVKRSSGTDEDELPAHKRGSVQYSTLVGPSFVDANTHSRAHALLRQTAHLTCIVNNLHNYTVSWVRARDIHLLTAADTTYTSDSRFVSVNPGGGSQWLLKIHHVQARDAGTYLCQVSQSPPLSTPVQLIVTEATATVFPGQEVFLKVGSYVHIICEVKGCPSPSKPQWYKGQQLQTESIVDENYIKASTTTATTTEYLSTALSRLESEEMNHPSPSPGVSLPPVLSTVITTDAESSALPVARVTLTRPRAQAAHSGLYTCTNTCTDPVNLTLHVLTDEKEPAALSRSCTIRSKTLGVVSLFHILIVITNYL